MDEPLVEVRLRADGFGLEIDCPGCGQVHHHAWGLGPRVSHCGHGPGEQAALEGYVLVASSDVVAAANTHNLRRLEEAEAGIPTVTMTFDLADVLDLLEAGSGFMPPALSERLERCRRSLAERTPHRGQGDRDA